MCGLLSSTLSLLITMCAAMDADQNDSLIETALFVLANYSITNSRLSPVYCPGPAVWSVMSTLALGLLE